VFIFQNLNLHDTDIHMFSKFDPNRKEEETEEMKKKSRLRMRSTNTNTNTNNRSDGEDHGHDHDDENTNEHSHSHSHGHHRRNNGEQEENERDHRRRRGAPSSQGDGDSDGDSDGDDNNYDNDIGLNSDSHPSLTSSFESRQGGGGERGRGGGSSDCQGGSGAGTGAGAGAGCEGKIRASRSRDTVSTCTTSLSHFDGNSYSSAGTLSHTSEGAGPLGHHHRRPGGRRTSPSSSSSPSPSRSRSMNMYNRQLNILMSSTGISLILFLFFFLNIFAFTALMSFAFSTFMLIYTSYAYITYLITSGELNVFSLLPESMRHRFLNTSIHDMLTDNSGYMENRFLLLYFIPGLTPEQILGMVNRLPQRHRDLVLGPGGVARMLLPPSINNRINRINNAYASASTSASTNSNAVQNSDSMNSAQDLALPVIEEENETFEEEEEITLPITNRDALQGILHTARSLITGDTSSAGDHHHESVEEESLYVNVDVDVDVDDNMNTSEDHPRVEFQDMSWEHPGGASPSPSREEGGVENEGQNENDDVQSRHSDSSDESDLGLDITSDDFTGNLPEGQLRRIARMVGLGSGLRFRFGLPRSEPSPSVQVPLLTSAPSSSTSPTPSSSTPLLTAGPSALPATVTARPMIMDIDMPLSPSSSQDSTDSQVLEEERNLEGEIINEAVSAMMNNYYDAAIEGITEVAANVADSVAPTIIRAGVRASSMSGLGLLGIFSSRMIAAQPAATAAMTGRVLGSGSRNLADGRAGRYAIRGLFSTLLIGLVSAGSAYLARAFIRRQRDLILNEKKKDDDKKCGERSQDDAETKG